MQRLAHRIILAIIASCLLLLAGCGFQGHAFVRKPDGSIGQRIEGVKITFVKEGTEYTKTVTTDENGHYKIQLSKGRYWVTATHTDYEDYSSVPGFFVVRGRRYQTGNIFLREPRVTTVLLVRHAEKAAETGDPPLSLEGWARAEKLAHAAWKAGVTAIYTTQYQRTQQTVQPLADSLRQDVTVYTDPASLASEVLTEHNGDVVFVVGHSNTVPGIIEEFGGGSIPSLGNEYDNLFVVTVYEPGQAHVLNLQYGESTLPDAVRGSHPLKTVLLVCHVEAGSAGASRAEQLTHVVRTAGVETIFGNPTEQTIQPVAEALGLEPLPYNESDIQALVDQILLDTGRIFVIPGEKVTARQMVDKFGAKPVPPIFENEYDNVYVLTLCDPGEAKLVNLQYGEQSP